MSRILTCEKGGLSQKKKKEARRTKASGSMNKVCFGQNPRRKSRRPGWKEEFPMESHSRLHVDPNKHWSAT